jgi:hypothetical protein
MPRLRMRPSGRPRIWPSCTGTRGGSRAVGSGYEGGSHLPLSHIPVVVVLTLPTYVEELDIYVYKHFRATSRYGTLSGTSSRTRKYPTLPTHARAAVVDFLPLGGLLPGVMGLSCRATNAKANHAEARRSTRADYTPPTPGRHRSARLRVRTLPRERPQRPAGNGRRSASAQPSIGWLWPPRSTARDPRGLPPGHAWRRLAYGRGADVTDLRQAGGGPGLPGFPRISRSR